MDDLDLRISVYKPGGGGVERILFDINAEHYELVRDLWGEAFTIELSLNGDELRGCLRPTKEPARVRGPKAFGQTNAYNRRQISWGSHYFDEKLWARLSTHKLLPIENITYDHTGIYFSVPDIHQSPSSHRSGSGGHGINRHNSLNKPDAPEPTPSTPPEAAPVQKELEATLTEADSLAKIKAAKDALQNLIDGHNTTKGFKSQFKLMVKMYTMNVEVL